jgi:hypothetical protein
MQTHFFGLFSSEEASPKNLNLWARTKKKSKKNSSDRPFNVRIWNTQGPRDLKCMYSCTFVRRCFRRFSHISSRIFFRYEEICTVRRNSELLSVLMLTNLANKIRLSDLGSIYNYLALKGITSPIEYFLWRAKIFSLLSSWSFCLLLWNH